MDIKMVEAMDKAEYPEQIRAMAQLGANPIYAMFDTVNEVVLDVADEFPDTKFYLIDCEMENSEPNCANLIVDPYEASFIAGFVAAKTTETGKLGWIGHTDHPTITRFRDGYTAGARYANPDIVVESAFTGDPSDPVKGQETAKIIIDRGVDVIFQSANQSGMGVIKACGEAGIKCIGVDEWQGDVDPASSGARSRTSTARSTRPARTSSPATSRRAAWNSASRPTPASTTSATSTSSPRSSRPRSPSSWRTSRRARWTFSPNSLNEALAGRGNPPGC